MHTCRKRAGVDFPMEGAIHTLQMRTAFGEMVTLATLQERNVENFAYDFERRETRFACGIENNTKKNCKKIGGILST